MSALVKYETFNANLATAEKEYSNIRLHKVLN